MKYLVTVVQGITVEAPTPKEAEDYSNLGHIGEVQMVGDTLRVPIIGPEHDDEIAIVYIETQGDLSIRVRRVDEAEVGAVQVIVV